MGRSVHNLGVLNIESIGFLEAWIRGVREEESRMTLKFSRVQMLGREGKEYGAALWRKAGFQFWPMLHLDLLYVLTQHRN